MGQASARRLVGDHRQLLERSTKRSKRRQRNDNRDEQTPPNTRRGHLYPRLTGDQDKHGTSPESQLDACRAKALALSLPIVAEIYDPGITGGYFLFRPGIQEALALISEGRADTLIFTTSSRMTRDREHLEIIKRTVKKAGGRLVFCDMDYTDTPTSNLHLNVKNDFEVYEKQLFRERSMTGKKKRADNGIQPARTSSPFGYHVPTTKDVLHGLYPLEMLGRYVIVPEEAALVRRLFECYAAGTHSLHRLCWELNVEGVPTAKGAAAWRPAALKAILANPVHKGSPAYGKVTHEKNEDRLSQINPLTGRPYICDITRTRVDAAEWITMDAPAIVSEEVWERAQERSAYNRAHKGGRPASVRMLSGRVVCPVCGGRMRFVQVTREGWEGYSCHRHNECLRAHVPSVCVGDGYSAPSVEGAVILSLSELSEKPEAVRAQVLAYAPAPSADPDAARREIAAVDRALSELSAQEAAAIQAQIAGIRAGASPDAYASVFADLAARRKDWESRRGELSRSVRAGEPKAKRGGEGAEATVQQEAVHRQAVADVRRVLTSPLVPGSEKRDALGMIVDKVICRRGGAEVVFLPGVLGFMFGDTVQSMSTPQPK